jgi:hypothetical protein
VAASATNAFGQHPGPGQVEIRKKSGIWERRGGEERRGEERRGEEKRWDLVSLCGVDDS